MQMLKDLQGRKRMTVLISSHDLNNITDVCNRILLMEKGKIIKDLQTSEDTLNELEDYFRV
jgi:ABC-2 type transport system ATP-binding protein